jgi:CheY-like chemotaxis protein/HPt (histidine-containing phosphotransfer) domain-containing protein
MIFGLIGLALSVWVAFNYIIGKPIKKLINSTLNAKIEAEESVKAKSRFLATMSHEIRTPIHGILGTAEHLKTRNLGSSENRMVGTIHTSSLALLRIVNDILDFSKFTDGKLSLKESDFDPQKTIYEAYRLLASEIYKKNLNAVVNCGETPLLPIVGDAGRFGQVIINLLSNAIKFTEEGHITVNARTVPKGDDVVLSVSVADSGRGIPVAEIPQLTDAFMQGKSNEIQQGTGLGLAICTQILEVMGSKLNIESTEGKGSIFSFEFTAPKGLITTNNSKVSRLKMLTATKEVNVLLVNGSPIVLNSQLQLLTALGINVFQAVDMVSAQKIASVQTRLKKPFDAAIIHSRNKSAESHSDDEIIAILQSLSAGNVTSISLTSPSPSFVDGKMNDSTGTFELCEPLNPESVAGFLLNALGRLQDLQEAKFEPEQRKLEKFPDGTRILVVDDNQINTDVLVNLLGEVDKDIFTANNGAEAVTLYRQHNPDVIFMDISMPVMNGNEAAKKIRSIEIENELPACTIIATTANVFEEDHQVSLDAGIDIILTKPIRRSDIMGVIQIFNTTPVTQTGGDPRREFPGYDINIDEAGLYGISDVEMKNVRKVIELLGAEKFQDLSSRYRQGCLEGFETLSHLASESNFELLGSLAHDLCGSSGTLGFRELSAEFQKLENCAKLRDQRACVESLEACKNKWSKVATALDNLYAVT